MPTLSFSENDGISGMSSSACGGGATAIRFSAISRATSSWETERCSATVVKISVRSLAGIARMP